MKKLLIVLLLFLACSAPGIKEGQNFSIILETDWKSQTRWKVIQYDKEHLEFISYLGQESADPHYAGGETSQNIFYFKALKPGETDVEFKLEKIWGTGDYGRTKKHIIIR